MEQHTDPNTGQLPERTHGWYLAAFYELPIAPSHLRYPTTVVWWTPFGYAETGAVSQ